MHPLHEQFAPAHKKFAEQIGVHSANHLLLQMAARELAIGHALLTQGAAADTLFFVLGGTLGVFAETKAGKPLRVGELTGGDCVGEVTFVDPGPDAMTVRAEEPTLALELRSNDLTFLIHDAPDVTFDLLDRLSVEIAQGVLTVDAAHLNSSRDGLEKRRVGSGKSSLGW
jgi:CRP-like cAMP-binding protein